MLKSATELQIFVALGGNLPSKAGPPLATMKAALAAMEAAGLKINSCSRWYESAPVPASDQPWYVNGVVSIITSEKPYSILKILNNIEVQFGRSRTSANAARPLDLDLLAVGDLVINEPGPQGLVLPHPRLAERGFVIHPWAEIAPHWRHPLTGKTVAEMAAEFPKYPICRLLGIETRQ